MAWFALFAAGLFEIVWAIALKYSNGFTNLWPSLIFGVSAWISFSLLSFALKSIPMGTAYAVWTGIGAVGLAGVGILWFGEPSNAIRLVCILLIIAGILGLKLSAAT